MNPPAKTHQTAIVLIPPESVWEPIQAIRRTHDRQVRRWMPHITLLYPFRPRAELGDVVPILEDSVRPLEPFDVALSEFASFRHRGSSHTMWLRPEPPDAVRGLHAQLLRAFPGCDDTARFSGGFNPHLSVGQFRGSRDGLRDTLETISATWRPIVFRVEAVSFIARDAPPDDVFEVVHEARLGA